MTCKCGHSAADHPYIYDQNYLGLPKYSCQKCECDAYDYSPGSEGLL